MIVVATELPSEAAESTSEESAEPEPEEFV